MVIEKESMLNVDDMPKFWFDKSNDSQSDNQLQEQIMEGDEQTDNDNNQYHYSRECKHIGCLFLGEEEYSSSDNSFREGDSLQK